LRSEAIKKRTYMLLRKLFSKRSEPVSLKNLKCRSNAKQVNRKL
jgi:hypothetical protein